MESREIGGIEFSIVNRSELNVKLRMDSDFHSPRFIELQRQLAKKPSRTIREMVKSTQYGLSIALNKEGIGVPMLKMDDITDIYANDENVKHADVSPAGFNKYKLERFDVLFNRVNSEEYVGRTAIYLLEGDHTFASYLIRLSPFQRHFNCYLTVFLNCSVGNLLLQRVKRRSVNQANINAEELKSLRIPNPTVAFQEKIREIVEMAHDLRTKSTSLYTDSETRLLCELGFDQWNRRINSKSKGSLSEKSEVAFETIRRKSATAKNRLDAEYWQSYLQVIVEKIQTYYNGWSFLHDACNVYEQNFIPLADVRYRYIEISNIGLYGNVVGCTDDFGHLLPDRARRIVENGHVIVPRLEGSSGQCALITPSYDGAVCSNGFYVMDSDVVNSETLLVLFKSLPFQELLRRACTGSIMASSPYHFLAEIPIPNLRLNVQRDIQLNMSKSNRLQELSIQLTHLAIEAVESYIEYDENKGLAKIENGLLDLTTSDRDLLA